MSNEYEIELNATEAPPVKYDYPVGTISPTNPFLQDTQQKSNMSYLEAFAESTLPHRVGIWASTEHDRIMRSYDQKDNLDNTDPSFDPFTVWKDGKYSPDEFHAISQMKNWDEYSLYKTVKDYENESAQRLQESGTLGETVAFFGDPSLYVGIGAEKLISTGLSSAAKFAISGTATVAGYESFQQIADITDRRSAEESLFNVAAAGVIGGALGKAVDTWGTRQAAKALSTGDKDFHAASSQIINDAQTLETRAQDLSAAAVKSNPEDSMILGTAARFAATGLRRISPKITGQTASNPESRAIMDSFFGRNLKTVADEKGVPRAISLGEEAKNIVDQSYGKVAKDLSEIDTLVKSGQVFDEVAQKQAILIAADGRIKDLSSNEISTVLARQHREYFGNFNKTLKELGVEGYNTLKDYAAPLLLKAELINRDFDGFVNKLVPRLEKAKLKAEQDVSAMMNELERMKQMGGHVDDIAELADEIRITREIASEASGDTASRARAYAHQMASGMQDGINTGKYQNKLIPNRFKSRVLDFKDFIDFVEIDPSKLKASYAREVAPFMASKKVFGYRTPKQAIEKFLSTMQENEVAARLAGDKNYSKITAEANDMAGSMTKGWDLLTGEHLSKQAQVYSKPIMNWLTAAKHFTSMTKLGAQVLASLNDMNAILLTHHLKGYGQFTNTLAKMATSPELRELGKKNALTIGVSFEKALHSELMQNLSNDFYNAEIFGTGVSGKAAKLAQYGSSKMQVFNGSTIFDTVVRRALVIAQQGVMKNNLEDFVAGTLAKNEATDLAFLGIGKRDASTILTQMKKHGEMVDGVFLANSEVWENANAKEVFERALLRDNRRTSLRPSTGDTPHVFHTPIVGLLTQFKSWSVTATQVYGLSALQRADAKHLMGISTMIGMASMAGVLNDVGRGNKVETDPEELLWNGINTSGILGALPDYGGSWLVHNYADINSGGGKYSDYQDINSMILGPTKSTVQDLWGATGAPLVQGLDPQQDVNYDSWKRSLFNTLPIPFVKPIIKNELLK